MSFLAITEHNEVKQGQISNKNGKLVKYQELALQEFKLYDKSKCVLKVDPYSTFAISDLHLISGLNLNNTFTVTKLLSLKEKISITFHKVKFNVI